MNDWTEHSDYIDMDANRPNAEDVKTPGLHRTGPAPYDFVYNPAEGQKVGFANADGTVYTGTITSVDEDEETGTTTITVT